MLLALRQQSIAGLLGIAKQHVGVLLEEDGVIDCRITNTERSLHHDNLQSHTIFLF